MHSEKLITMNFKPAFYLLILVLSVLGCKTKKELSSDETYSPDSVYIDESYSDLINNGPFNEKPDYSNAIEYKGSYQKDFVLLHTHLAVSFNWVNETVDGKATIYCKPNFYPRESVTLDAKKMNIKSVKLLGKKEEKNLSFTYDSLKLTINLDKEFTRNDTVVLKIEYTAFPSRFNDTYGGGAVTDDNGLYFINSKGNPSEPMPQIWTQNEPEYASVWFPTFDSPNQRHTQELEITVDNKYLTLSNGKLLKQVDNKNGTRTDVWRQDKSHAPYLTMLAVGEFAKIDDKAGKLPLAYYVEKQYAADAKAMFGATPRMIELLNKLYGIPYPWDKYDQIVVRNFVSGAMENTTATVFGDFVYARKSDLVDANQEEIIVHELAHHWFGDLVTCESWANLVLNEGFASYAENLWYEYAYDQYYAQYHRHNDLRDYISEASYNPKKVLRYQYEGPNDLFDAHSYQKGAILLFQLRKFVGDEVFFESIKQYLQKFQFKSAELADLRMVFEEVSGLDLVWYFNQWFERAEYPNLYVGYDFVPETKKVVVKITQEMHIQNKHVFHLPLDVAIYENGIMRIEKIVVEKNYQEFEIQCETMPDLVIVDPEYTLVGECTRAQTNEQYIYQLQHVKHVISQFEAMDGLILSINEPQIKALYEEALKHPFWAVRNKAMEHLFTIYERGEQAFNQTILNLAKNDPNSYVRQNAFSYYRNQISAEIKDLCVYVLENDSSAAMLNSAMFELGSIDKDLSLKYAAKYKNNAALISGICSVYGQYGTESDGAFFIEALNVASFYEQFTVLSSFESYLVNQSPEVAEPYFEQLLKLHASRNIEMWDQNIFTMLYQLMVRWETIAESEDIYNYTKLSKPELKKKIENLNRVFASLRNAY